MAMRNNRQGKALPDNLCNLLAEVGMSDKMDEGAVWNCHGTPVILHKALERIADHTNILFSEPTIVEANSQAKVAVICVTGKLGDKTAWSIGESAPSNTTNSYPYAMAEKRAKDRVILKLIGASGFVYSEEEADDFKNSKPDLVPTQKKPLSKEEAEWLAHNEATLDQYTLKDLEVFMRKPFTKATMQSIKEKDIDAYNDFKTLFVETREKLKEQANG
tara:strand:- start:13160 stop:13813 length:654 start_codon:yes stop_codon:yes gene_type:complete